MSSTTVYGPCPFPHPPFHSPLFSSHLSSSPAPQPATTTTITLPLTNAPTVRSLLLNDNLHQGLRGPPRPHGAAREQSRDIQISGDNSRGRGGAVVGDELFVSVEEGLMRSFGLEISFWG